MRRNGRAAGQSGRVFVDAWWAAGRPEAAGGGLEGDCQQGAGRCGVRGLPVRGWAGVWRRHAVEQAQLLLRRFAGAGARVAVTGLAMTGLTLVHSGHAGCSSVGAVSSVGRASRLHREGRRFEPVTAHQSLTRPRRQIWRMTFSQTTNMQAGATHAVRRWARWRRVARGGGACVPWTRCEQQKSAAKPRLITPHIRVARVTGLEPATSGVTGRRSNQLSYTPKTGILESGMNPAPAIGAKHFPTFRTGKVARVTGLEPATSGVTGRRSNQLSYTPELASWPPVMRGLRFASCGVKRASMANCACRCG